MSTRRTLSVLDGHDLDVTKVVMFRTVSNDFQPGEELDYDMLLFFSPAGIASLKKNFPEFNQDKRPYLHRSVRRHYCQGHRGYGDTASIFRLRMRRTGRCPAPWRILSRSSQKSDRTPSRNPSVMKDINETILSRLYPRRRLFQNLMQKRIFNVLLVATPYDAFMLEEDGRVEEQVYNEYVSLNLSSPPRFTKVANYEEARAELAAKEYDLVIAMPGVDVSETFREAVLLDELYPHIPFVVLTPFSRKCAAA